MRNRVVKGDLARITSADLPWSAFASRTVLICDANYFVPAYMVETLLRLSQRGLSVPCRMSASVQNCESLRERVVP